MQSSVRTFLPVIGDAEPLAMAFDGDPGRWLPDAHRDGPSRWILPVRAGSLRHLVRAEVGDSWRGGSTRWRRLAWKPVAVEGDPGLLERALPSLESEIGLYQQPDGRSTLIVDAWYEPPGGAIGAAADAVALRRVARSTIETLLHAIAARLAAEALLIDPAAHGPGRDSRQTGTDQTTSAPPWSREEISNSPPRA